MERMLSARSPLQCLAETWSLVDHSMEGELGYVFLDDPGELVLFRLTEVWKSDSVRVLSLKDWNMPCLLMRDAPLARIGIERNGGAEAVNCNRTGMNVFSTL